MTLGIQVFAWDRHKHVAVLKLLLGFQRPLDTLSAPNQYKLHLLQLKCLYNKLILV